MLAMLVTTVAVACMFLLSSVTGVDAQIFADGAKSKYLVLHIKTLGFANRMRVMADMNLIASLTHRQLLVSWQPTRDCNITITELFEELPNSVKVLPFILPDDTKGRDLVQELAIESHLSFLDLQHEGFVMERDMITNPAIDVIYSDYNGVVSLRGTPCELYTYARSQFYSALLPVKEIRDTVSEIAGSYFGSHIMVGVHFRDFDPMFDWSVVPPVGSDQAGRFGEGANFEHFEYLMGTLHNHFHNKSVQLQRRGLYGSVPGGSSSNGNGLRNNVRFYIASNSDSVKERFLQTFPDAVTLSGSHSGGRGAVEGMKLAVVEWFLLSQCVLLINTYGSSFAAEASQVHLRPIVGIWGGHSVLYNDVQLPYCGNLQFVRNYGQQGDDVQYSESLTSNGGQNRVIAAKQIQLRHCDRLEHWGLHDIYSVQSDDVVATPL